MELKEGVDLICATERNLFRGRVSRAITDGFVELAEVTILDLEGRTLRKVPHIAINLGHVSYWMEDERAPVMTRIKKAIDLEDYELALSEIVPLLVGADGDGDLNYLAGVAYQRLGSEQEASDSFKRALKLTVDPRLREVISRHLDSIK